MDRKVIFLCSFLIAITFGKSVKPDGKPFGLEDYKQKHGFVNVRPHAFKFWWLFYSTHAEDYTTRPLIMWLQGGPGGSSTGYGNFEIIGPLDLNLNPRESTWIQEANILFVDNPVGTGYSYVEREDAYTTDGQEIAIDLTTLMKEFLNENPEFKTVPFYVFGQSYGGKMAAEFARHYHKAIESGEVESNLAGFAMGNAWTSPEDSTITWAPLLFWMSVVDEPGRDNIQAAATACQSAINAGLWQLATNLWRATQLVVFEESNYVDFYNILNYLTFDDFKTKMSAQIRNDSTWFRHLTHPRASLMNDDPLDALMNGVVKEHLGIPENLVWGAQSDMVFTMQEGDFMKPVWDIVSELLETTDMDVIVYQGQLDLICDTKGAVDWVKKMSWSGLNDYVNADRLPLIDPITKQTEVFVKAHKNFKFYWNLEAGHAVPKDQGPAARRMLQRILQDLDN